MVRAYVEEGWWACFEKSIGVWSGWKRKWGRPKKMWKTKCWFGGGCGCLKSSEMESGSWRDCCQSGVHPATPVYRDKPGSKLDDGDDDVYNVYVCSNSVHINYLCLLNRSFLYSYTKWCSPQVVKSLPHSVCKGKPSSVLKFVIYTSKINPLLLQWTAVKRIDHLAWIVKIQTRFDQIGKQIWIANMLSDMANIWIYP